MNADRVAPPQLAEEIDNGRRSPLLLVAFAVALLTGGTLIFAMYGPEDRATAIVSAVSAVSATAAALTAVWLGREAIAQAQNQVSEARRATVLSRYPLVLPIHQPLTQTGTGALLSEHPPAEERYVLPSGPEFSRCFVADTRDRFNVPLENVGEGPALELEGTLTRVRDLQCGRLVGVQAMGAGSFAVSTASLTRVRRALPKPLSDYIDSHDELINTDAYCVELAYKDVFGVKRCLAGVFDPRGLGSWQLVTGKSVSDAQAPNEWKEKALGESPRAR